MPIQPGESIVGDFIVWQTEPNYYDYEDHYAYENGVAGSGTITNIPTRIRSEGIVNTAFSQPYDRYEIIEALYLTDASYSFTVNYDDGSFINFNSFGQATINSFAINRSAIELSEPLPLDDPTLRDINDSSVPLSIRIKDTHIRPQPIATSWELDVATDYSTRFNSTYSLTQIINPRVNQYTSNIVAKTWSVAPPRNSFSTFAKGTKYQITQIPTIVRYYRRALKPNYIDLLSGYELDERTIPNYPIITPVETRTIDIGYYRENKLENIAKLRSIDWMQYRLELNKGIAYKLPIIDCVLGTLVTDSLTIANICDLSTINNKYPFEYYFKAQLPEIFEAWNLLYNPSNTPLPVNVAEIRILRVIGANNNYWNNRSIETLDMNVDLEHPMFAVDNTRAFNWHIKPQSDGSYGDLVMDSPRVIAIATVLDALNLSLDPATGLPRVANLAHLIHRTASLLGYRPEPNGTFKPEKEKALVRQIINNNEPIDSTKVGVNNFGSLGMIMRRLNNSFKGKKIVADECVIVRDLPQIMAEYQDQLNLALGLQESSAIEIKGTDNTARYENQLAVMIELLNLVKSSNESIRAALISSLVAQAQSSEIIAALGLPTVTKSLPVTIDNKIDHLPYKGVSAHRSISQEIAVCTANVGIVLGQVL